MRRLGIFLFLLLCGAMPAAAVPERGPLDDGGRHASESRVTANFQDMPLSEIFRTIAKRSGVIIRWPEALGEERFSVNLDQVPVERAIRLVLKGSHDARNHSLAVIYEQGIATPKQIIIIGSTGSRDSSGDISADEESPSVDAENAIPYIAPEEPPRYVPLARSPQYVPFDDDTREIPIRVAPEVVPSR